MWDKGRSFPDFLCFLIGDGANFNAYLLIAASATRPELVNILKAMSKLVINLSSDVCGVISEFDEIVLV